MSLRKLIKDIEESGFTFTRQKGTHRIYTNGKYSLTVPMKDGDKIGFALEIKIRKQLKRAVEMSQCEDK